MKTSYLRILTFVLVLWLIATESKAQTVYYEGSWHGAVCSITMNRVEYAAATTFSGNIHIRDTKQVFPFTGSIDYNGVATLSVAGDPDYIFQVTKAGGREIFNLKTGGIAFSRMLGSGLPLPNNGGGGGLPLPNNGGGGGLPLPNNGGGGGLPLPNNGGGGGLPLPNNGGNVTPQYKPDAITTNYSGFLNGTSVRVQINWSNYKGLGLVDGQIYYNAAWLKFTGNNSSPGFMVMNINGVSGTFTLTKAGSGKNLKWSGSSDAGATLTFSRSTAVNPGVAPNATNP